MVSAVVLLNTDFETSADLVDNLRSIKGVEEAHALYGIYDFLVKVKVDSIDDLRAMTSKRIKKVAGVTSSITLMVTDHPSRCSFLSVLCLINCLIHGSPQGIFGY